MRLNKPQTLIGGSGSNHEEVLASGRCSTCRANGITRSKRTIDISIRERCPDISHIPLQIMHNMCVWVMIFYQTTVRSGGTLEEWKRSVPGEEYLEHFFLWKRRVALEECRYRPYHRCRCRHCPGNTNKALLRTNTSNAVSLFLEKQNHI